MAKLLTQKPAELAHCSSAGLDLYYHPFAYRDIHTVGCDDAARGVVR